MNARLLACLVCALTCGCTNLRLERSVTGQARTLSDVQYQQVMDNLAMYYSNPWALPSQVAMRDGSAQVADSGTAGFLGQTDFSHSWASSPFANGSRSVVEQWGILPVTDENNLRLLRIAYRRAVFGVDESLATDPELRNKVAHELKGQIAVTEDLRRSTEAYYQSQASRSLSDYYQRLAAGPAAPGGPSPSPLQVETGNNLPSGAESVAARSPSSPGPDYPSFDAQIASADDNCFDCQFDEGRPVEIAIRDGKPNQGYPVEIRAGQSVVWSNEGVDAVLISGDAGPLPVAAVQLAGGTKSPPVRIPWPSRGRYEALGFPYTVGREGQAGAFYYLRVGESDASCDSEEPQPKQWVIQLAPPEGATVGGATGLHIGEDSTGQKALQIRAGDIVVWHNDGPRPLVIESAPGNPYRFALTAEPRGDSPPLRFPKADQEAGVDGFRYRIRPSVRGVSIIPSGKLGEELRGAVNDSNEDLRRALIDRYSQRKGGDNPANLAKADEEVRLSIERVKAANQAAVEAMAQVEGADRILAEAAPFGKVTGVIRVGPKKTRTPLTIEVCRRIKDVNKDLTDVHPGWFGHGGKHDVPWKTACYVGRCGDCYTWVEAANLRDLSEFTLTVLSLATTVKESQVVTAPGGPRYSPGIPIPVR